MINDLLMLSGNDIPFEQAHITIHQPTIKEIAYIGEEAFFNGIHFLKFSKDMLSQEDRTSLEGISNFKILMSMVNERNVVMQTNKTYMLLVLTLLFPNYTINFNIDNIELKRGEEQSFISEENFEEFGRLIKKLFFNDGGEDNQDFNPGGDMASRIADKLKNRHQKLAEQKGDNRKIAVLSRYVSILSAGEKIDINTLLQYTVYQLYDAFRRFLLKSNYDLYVKAKMAGAQDLEEVDDWMQDLHP